MLHSPKFKNIFVFIMLLVSFSSLLQAESLTAGILFDGACEKTTELLASIDSEIKTLLPPDKEILISDKYVSNANWAPLTAKTILNNYFNNPKIDFVIAIGPMCSNILAQWGQYKKPSFATHIINAKIQNLPTENNITSIDNLNFIDHAIDPFVQLDYLQELVSFQTFHFVLPKYIAEAVPELINYVESFAAEKGLNVSVVIFDNNLKDVLKKLEKAQVVYLAPLEHLKPTTFKDLITALNQNRVPSLNMYGTPAVEAGAFVTISAESDNNEVARRLALNIQRLFNTENPANFSTSFSIPRQVTINMETARTIGLYPTWEQMIDAKLINEKAISDNLLSITQVIEKAVIRNLQLAAIQQQILAGDESINRARSYARPKLNVFSRHDIIDSDRALSMMMPPKHQTKIGAELLYVINSEEVNKNVDIGKIMQSITLEEERTLVLDIINDVSLAYLNALRANTMLTIQEDNLEVTRINLELAKLREEVGRSAPAEVYRWEIAMINARQAIIEAETNCKKAELLLNQLLNASEDEEFSVANEDIFSQVFLLDYLQVTPYMDNPYSFGIFSDFMTADTFAYSPELQQINMAIEIQRRSQLAAKRRYRQPTISVQGNFSRTVRERGAGTENPALPPAFADIFPMPDRDDWYLGLNMSLPLHDGGKRPAELKEAEANIRKLMNEQELLLQKLELNTRVKLEDARSSFASISLAYKRVDFALKSLELVQDAYSRGAINILDLIDAQNAALTAKEASTNAIYGFLSDFVRVCRAVGTFDFMISHEANQNWYKRVEEYYKDHAEGRTLAKTRRPQAISLFETPTSKKVLYQEIER